VKIAFYCPNKPLLHPHPSGDLVIARGIAEELNRTGHTCREMATFRSRWFWKSPRGWRNALEGLRAAWKTTRAFHPDVWLTYHTYYKSPDILGPLICTLQNIPYILFQPMYATKWRKRPETRPGFTLNRIALRACRHAFTNNQDDLEALLRVLPADKLTHLTPGILPEDFQRDEAAGRALRALYGIPPDTPLLLSVARFRPGVKFESLVYLFNSLVLVRKMGQDFICLVAGDGAMEAELQMLAESALPRRVIFAGRVARGELHRFYSAADLFVFPGIGESLGMVFLEAQACGLPVVALNTGGIPQVVQAGRTGLLVPQDGGEAMARAIHSLLRDPKRRAAMAAAGPAFIQDERNLHRNYLELARRLEHIAFSG
jgi:glycosyltransferase involved in cell wall biosynthesis